MGEEECSQGERGVRKVNYLDEVGEGQAHAVRVCSGKGLFLHVRHGGLILHATSVLGVRNGRRAPEASARRPGCARGRLDRCGVAVRVSRNGASEEDVSRARFGKGMRYVVDVPVVPG
jgi:hypothetical protein